MRPRRTVAIREGGALKAVGARTAIGRIDDVRGAELAVDRALNHVVAFEDHEETVGSTLMQAKRCSNLGQTKGNIAFTEQIKDCKGAVKRLNLIRTLRRIVSHCDIPSR